MNTLTSLSMCVCVRVCVCVQVSPVLTDLVKQGKLKIVGGVYDLATGKVCVCFVCMYVRVRVCVLGRCVTCAYAYT
jgi:hypothetical protein